MSATRDADVEAALEAIRALLYAVEQGHWNAASRLYGTARQSLATIRAALAEKDDPAIVAWKDVDVIRALLDCPEKPTEGGAS